MQHAYRNHPTRYLIVKDPGRFRSDPAAAGGRREPGEVTRPAARCQHLFFTRPRCAVAPRSVSASRRGGAFLRVPARPVNTFFQPGANRLRASPRARFPEAESGYLPDRFRPVNTFFQKPSEDRCPRTAPPVSRSGPHCLADPAVPVNTFFQPTPKRPCAPARNRLPVRGGTSLRIPGRPVNSFFQISSGRPGRPGIPQWFPAAGVRFYVPRAGPSSYRLPSPLVFSKTSSMAKVCDSHFPDDNW